ncbi:chemotaxis protein CheW [Stigmatella aurantiaca]|uniref:CheW protein n=1 Tax=Stigmatella aurantiaca (strain DW4/3-1) TaxID=378806 RepID=Q096M4_STIAD|nr:chemotaxis protein CheW [Stigmatella aurantiaca]ADO68679.1 Chemotaxis signal transduction protein [Stigmatella aurantiaca DW4/3-1]EAU67650.1 CheW protein [Stigmatella aurantiaca DW4/3-1]
MTPTPHEVLLFVLEGQRYALPSADVRELARAVSLTPLPHAPDVVEGLLNLRGKLLPVLDLRRRFRLPPRPLSPSDHFIIARAGPRDVGLRVDRAEGLLSLEPGTLDETPRELPGVGYVAGAVKLPDGLVLVHDLRTFLSEAESLALASALTAVPGAS